MNSEHLTRQLDLIPMDKLNQKITVIGAGAIGSFTILALAKMGFQNIEVWDFDKVSPENMNCQWFRISDIGRPKVEALQEIIAAFTGTRIHAINSKWEGNPLEGIVITAVDSMRVRAAVWKSCKKRWQVRWYIDPRMAAEYALSYVMDPSDEKDQITYEKTLYTDENAVQEPCTAKATMYTATMIAGHVAKHVKDVVTGGQYARVTQWDIAKNNQLTWGKQNESPDRGNALHT